jgi:di/tricarboxylate transporter
VIGLRRGREVITDELLAEKLRVGDTLLVTGFWEDIRHLQHGGSDLVPLDMPEQLEDVLPAHDRAPHALAILALVVTLMVTGVVPNVHAVLIGVLLLGFFRCIDIAERLSGDQLAKPGADRRHDALFPGTAAHRGGRSRR